MRAWKTALFLVCVMTSPLAGCDCGNGTGSDSGVDSATTDSGDPFMVDAGPPLAEGVDPSVPAGPGEVRAGRVTNDSADALLTGDPTEGRVGDWLVYNACVRFVIQDARLGNGYVPGAGSLIDADLVRPDGFPDVDQIWKLVTLLGLRVFEATEVGVLDDGSSGGPAIVRAIGRDEMMGLINGAAGLGGQTENLVILQDYVLLPDECYVEIRTTVVHDGSHSASIGMGDFVLLAGDQGLPFGDGTGFAGDGLLASHDYVGVVEYQSQQALLIFPEAESRLDSPAGELLAELGSDGLFLYEVARPSLPLYEYFTFRRYVALGPDVDATTRIMHAIQGTTGLGTVSGTVSDPGGAPVAGARVHVVALDSGSERWATFAATAADGSYSAEVPAGDYDVTATAEGVPFYAEGPTPPSLQFPFADGREPSAPTMVTVSAGNDATADLSVGAVGTLDLTITDGNGAPIAARVQARFAGADPSPPNEMLGEANLLGKKAFWTVTGQIDAPLAPGSYDLVFAHGLDAEIDVRAGEVVPPDGVLTINDVVLPEVVDHTGYLAVDTHVHAAASMDSIVPYNLRVATLLAAGLDFIVSTDHDFVWDYTPHLIEMGVANVTTAFMGEEVSPIAHHFNAFPAMPVMSDQSGGAIRWFDELTSTAELTDAIRSELNAGVIQVNHGRSSSGMFTAAGYDPATGMVSDPFRWSDDFDAMEILNGGDYGDAEDLLLDWFSLLNAGRRVIGTGSSDEHGYGKTGYARTYLGLTESDPTMLLPTEIVESFASGNIILSGGPFLAVDIDGLPPGAEIDGSAGMVTLTVEVLAPSWIPVDEITIVANGVPIMTVPASAPAPPVWMSEVVVLSPPVDTWYVVRADGSTDLGPALPGRRAFAVSNPIFVDVDGGGFDAPGL